MQDSGMLQSTYQESRCPALLHAQAPTSEGPAGTQGYSPWRWCYLLAIKLYVLAMQPMPIFECHLWQWRRSYTKIGNEDTTCQEHWLRFQLAAAAAEASLTCQCRCLSIMPRLQAVLAWPATRFSAAVQELAIYCQGDCSGGLYNCIFNAILWLCDMHNIAYQVD